MDLVREFGALIDAFNREGVEYAVCGGDRCDNPRIRTHDEGHRISDSQLRRDRVVKMAEQAGFLDDSGNIPFGLGTDGQTIVRRVVKCEGRDLLMLDLILVSPLLEPAWENRTKVDWERRLVSIVSRDGLALMKSLAGRDQDLTDFKQLGTNKHERTA